jgi:hypothetical protein
MGIIKKLEFHESDELDQWIDESNEENEVFLKEIADFAITNFNELSAYCDSIKIREFSSLTIVYRALSEHSNQFHPFFFDEIKRVISLATEKRIKNSRIEVLEDIDLEIIYEEDRLIYNQIINYLISQLNSNRKDSFSLAILDLLDMYLLEISEEDVDLQVESWMNSMNRFAERSSFEVKMRTREVLQDLDFEVKLPKLSFTERIKSVFKS